jgi:hypothetical protein
MLSWKPRKGSPHLISAHGAGTASITAVLVRIDTDSGALQMQILSQCCERTRGGYNRYTAAGITVKKGAMYWVVLRPLPQHQDTYDVWNNNFNGVQGAFSNNIGSGWTKQSL